jgi:hypothetical protein
MANQTAQRLARRARKECREKVFVALAGAGWGAYLGTVVVLKRGDLQMRKPALWIAAASLAAIAVWPVAVLPQDSTSENQAHETPPIGSRTIQFGDAQVTGNRFAVRAFVPTGSLSQHCLATISESNFAVPGISVLCAPREFAGQQGILFSAFFPQPVPAGLILSATVYQEFAHGYGEPVFFCAPSPNC